jgi:hypothetical protein
MDSNSPRYLRIADSEKGSKAPDYDALQDQIARVFGNRGPLHKRDLERFPFSLGDTTAGTETELQAAVKGRRETVDLPRFIEGSNYYANIARRAASGDMPKKAVSELEKYLLSNTDGVWENSLVWFKRSRLNAFAEAVFRRDILADKKNRFGGVRSDAHKFVVFEKGDEYLRVPVSYLLKLALADLTGRDRRLPRMIQRTGHSLMGCFTNDNTSPETHSFHVISTGPDMPLGEAVAAETSRRFLLTQLLVRYANGKFGLKDAGQEACAYFSPHPPVRQKRLSECVSDAFYRELFMSPCLSGWDDGESKHRYMHLCHEVLSRSQLNAVVKLKEAGILYNNLAVLPSVSSIGLSNNGLHLSLGSSRLRALIEDGTSGFTARHEKYAADLAVKIVEHFLPLFVGTYTAAPYRFSFPDFHPEKALGFLPHELDYTHLRMFWRRWKKKAKIKVLGNSITPFGPQWLDRFFGRMLNLKGDYVPDNRLLNYLVFLMSTETSPALNGVQGNTADLKNDLADLGVFHRDMSVYLLYKPREYRVMGFSGFEGRFYSLFDSFTDDLGSAAAMQNLITALAYKYIIEKKVGPHHIPDRPFIESERRQTIFDAAVGIPTFFVRGNSDNLFLKSLLTGTSGVRQSRRYPGYLRVRLDDYRKALLDRIRDDAPELIEMFGMEGVIDDLARRIGKENEATAASKLKRGVLQATGLKSPLDASGDDYNLACEKYYREGLLLKHLNEALDLFGLDLQRMEAGWSATADSPGDALRFVVGNSSATAYYDRLRKGLKKGSMSEEELVKLVYLLLIVEHVDRSRKGETKQGDNDGTPIYRAGNS